MICEAKANHKKQPAQNDGNAADLVVDVPDRHGVHAESVHRTLDDEIRDAHLPQSHRKLYAQDRVKNADFSPTGIDSGLRTASSVKTHAFELYSQLAEAAHKDGNTILRPTASQAVMVPTEGKEEGNFDRSYNSSPCGLRLVGPACALSSHAHIVIRMGITQTQTPIRTTTVRCLPGNESARSPNHCVSHSSSSR